MEKNVGFADAVVRCLTGIAFLVNIIILEPGIVGLIILLLLGLVLIKSAATGYCPLYKVLDITTVPASGQDEADEGAEQAAH